jgi:hypothetical protein
MEATVEKKIISAEISLLRILEITCQLPIPEERDILSREIDKERGYKTRGLDHDTA